jgi:hypothetical protein
VRHRALYLHSRSAVSLKPLTGLGPYAT